MEVAALTLLLLLNSLDSTSARVSLTVSPKRSQFFKYERFLVSCEEDGSGDEEEAEGAGWRVMKRMTDGEVFPCPSSCLISAAFPSTDTGEYWCQTGPGETSNTVNITVTGGAVILDSPVLPVPAGDNVTLTCRQEASTCNLTADFYKDGVHVGTRSTGTLSLVGVSGSDEGLYSCKVCGHEESPRSFLAVRAPPREQSTPHLSVFTLVRPLVVGAPYLLSTVVLGLIYWDRTRAKRTRRGRQACDDVVMEMAT
ncbi:uncharacterized protein V6R79_022379 [Siganus canaliculatus]